LPKPSPLGTEGFLATSESDSKSIYGFSLKTLRELLRNSPVKQQIVFIEACHSGAFFQSFEPDKEHDICFVTSARANEPALAKGLLTQALLNLLNCTKQSGGYVTSDSLIKRLQEKIRLTSGWQRFQWRIYGQKIELCEVTTLKGKLRKIVAGFLKFLWRIIYLSSVTIFLVSLASGIFFYYREDFVELIHETKTEKPTPSISNQPETKKIEKPVQVAPLQEKREDVQVSIPKTIDSLQAEQENIQVFAQQGLTNIWRMKFSPDGKTILSSASGGTVNLLDVTSGREIRTMAENLTRAVGLGFSNTQTALIADWERNVWQWDLTSGTQIQLMKADYRRDCGSWHTAAFSSDGKKLLGGCSGKTLELWNLESNYILYNLVGHSDFISVIRFSPNNNIAASGSEDNTIKLWNLSTGQEIHTLNGNQGGINSVAFSPDSKTILSGGDDKILKLWNISTGGVIRTFKGHSDRIWSIDISPDGKTAVSGSFDNLVKVWNMDTGDEIYTLNGHFAWLRTVGFSPDGNVILSGDENGVINFWDTASGQLIRSVRGHAGMQSVAVSHNGNMVLAGSSDGILHLWNVVSGKKIRTLGGHSNNSKNTKAFSNSVDAIALSPDGHIALSGSRDETAKLWNLDSGREIYTLKGHNNSIGTVAISPNGQIALTGSSDKTIKLWDISSGQEIRTLRGHSYGVLSAAFSPDGRTILSGDIDLKSWDISTGQEIYTLKGGASNIFDIKFSPDGQTALSSHFNSVVKLWDISSGKEIRTLRGHTGRVYAVNFSPDGQTALSGGEDGTLKLWDIASGYQIRELKNVPDTRDIVFLPGSHNALSVSYTEPTIRLWNTDTGKEVVKLITFNDGEWVTITPEGYYQASANGDKYINVRTKDNQVTGIEEYKHIYHRPDIVQLALKLGDSQQAIAQYGKK